MRKDLFTGRKPNQSKVDKLLKQGVIKDSDKELYNRMPAAVAQRTIQIVGESWSSFAAAKCDWKKHPEKYLGRPNLPKYSKRAKTVYIPRSSFYVRDNCIHFAQKLGLEPIKLGRDIFPNQAYNANAKLKTVTEVRLVPTGSGFKFEVIYDKNKLSQNDSESDDTPPIPSPDKNNFLSIDLGVGRFAALVSNKAGVSPFLINGGELKSVNHWYNKRCAELHSKKKYKHIPRVAAKRNRKVRDTIHKISRYITNLCVEHDIGVVIVGRNKLWKTGSNMGDANNQNMVGLPHAVFVSMLEYKLKEHGIELILQEESYTSKASYLDGDAIPTYKESDEGEDKAPYNFSGRRSKRGLYKTKEKYLINADINGAANISRKAGYEGISLVSSGVVITPTLIAIGDRVRRKKKAA